MSVVLLAALIAVICTALYLRHKKRELAALEHLKNLANGEYLNWAKAERGFSEEQGTYPTAAGNMGCM